MKTWVVTGGLSEMSQQPFLLQRGEWQVSGSLDPKPAFVGPEVPGDLGQSP